MREFVLIFVVEVDAMLLLSSNLALASFWYTVVLATLLLAPPTPTRVPFKDWKYSDCYS